MQGYLRTTKIEGGSTTLDVMVDYPGGTDMSVDSMVEVRITGANGFLHGMAYVGLQYPWFEAEENVEAWVRKLWDQKREFRGFFRLARFCPLDSCVIVSINGQ